MVMAAYLLYKNAIEPFRMSCTVRNTLAVQYTMYHMLIRLLSIKSNFAVIYLPLYSESSFGEF